MTERITIECNDPTVVIPQFSVAFNGQLIDALEKALLETTEKKPSCLEISGFSLHIELRRTCKAEPV